MGIFVNLGLALAKCTAGLLGNSIALTADGLESAADVITGLVVYFGLKIAVKPPDQDHPYGHGKAEPIAALLVGFSLIGAAVIVAFESIHGIITPHPPPSPYTLIVLAGVLIVKELLFRHVGHVGDSIRSLAVRSDAWHHRSDAITSAFAFAGISIALVGGRGWEVADRWAGLCAASVVLYSAWRQLRPAILELGDVAPDPNVEAQIRAIAAHMPGVIGLDKCFVRKMGFNFYADLHIVVNGELSVREGHRIAHDVEKHVLRAYHKYQKCWYTWSRKRNWQQGEAPRTLGDGPECTLKRTLELEPLSAYQQLGRIPVGVKDTSFPSAAPWSKKAGHTHFSRTRN